MADTGTRRHASTAAATDGAAAQGERSASLFERARARIPGGVNSPVRAQRAVGGRPRFLVSGRGAEVTDADGRTYIDWAMSYGPLILGHAHPAVTAAVAQALNRGTTFGAPTEGEVLLAETIAARVPSIERVRMVSSGTEATMSALRLARAYTRRDAVVKFAGGYHGHADPFLAEAGSGALTGGTPASAGVPAATAAETLVVPYNDLAAVARALASRPVAALFVEPVAGNMGTVPPAPGFLEGLRRLCDEYGTVLVFDEVITGFRVAAGGAQSRFGVRPDLTTLGKIVGGGLPVGAFGGRAEIMALVAPEGPVYQAGTLSGNPLAMAAGLATLRELAAPAVYEGLEATSAALQAGLEEAAQAHGVALWVGRVGSMLTPFFTSKPVTNLEDAKAADGAAYARFYHAMAARGVLLPPSPFECMFVSTAHTAAAVERTLAAAREAMAVVAAG
jgi:glutamate-1-semialdehyde 2,1-aminomutase